MRRWADEIGITLTLESILVDCGEGSKDRALRRQGRYTELRCGSGVSGDGDWMSVCSSLQEDSTNPAEATTKLENVDRR